MGADFRGWSDESDTIVLNSTQSEVSGPISGPQRRLSDLRNPPVMCKNFHTQGSQKTPVENSIPKPEARVRRTQKVEPKMILDGGSELKLRGGDGGNVRRIWSHILVFTPRFGDPKAPQITYQNTTSTYGHTHAKYSFDLEPSVELLVWAEVSGDLGYLSDEWETRISSGGEKKMRVT